MRGSIGSGRIGRGSCGVCVLFTSTYVVEHGPNNEGVVKAILPKELWDVVDSSLRKGANTHPGPDKAAETRFNLNDFSDNEDAEGDEKMDDSEAENNAELEEVDEDWEDDEDEGDDYNGEKYFDDGERDDVVGADEEFGDDLGGGEEVQEREFDPGEEFEV
jgi:hypothetical protein